MARRTRLRKLDDNLKISKLDIALVGDVIGAVEDIAPEEQRAIDRAFKVLKGHMKS